MTKPRLWRFTIEVGQPEHSPPAVEATPDGAPPPAAMLDDVWPTLVGGRKNLAGALKAGDSDLVASIKTWMGGAIAATSKLTGVEAEVIQSRLDDDVPESVPPSDAPVQTPGFYRVERKRPAPPPGAPRKISVDELSAEERLEMGID